MPKTPMTRRGAEQLREELQRLRSVERPAVTQAIADARSHGDLESKLANAQEIDPKLLDAEGRCVFGATVDVEEDGGEKATWQIVGEDEADIKAGKISYSSPLGRALIGKESGEKVDVQTPGGVKRYDILDVRYE